MSNKFMARLLSENSNEPCDQPKTDVENELYEGELSFKGLIRPEKDVNDITSNGLSPDLINSSAQKERNEACNNQVEIEVIPVKETIVLNEIENEVSTASNFKVTETKIDSEANVQKYREDLDSSDNDTSSTFSLDSSSDCSDSFLDKMHQSCSSSIKIPNIKTKGELDLDELPPIEELTIDVTEREMQKVGSIYAIVEKLVIVRASKDLQPLNLDSVLFLSYTNPLGRIFDVFGPVVEPFYAVRFNSPEHIADKCIIIDADVFFAPEKTDITSYVFVDQLKKQKGSDASWQDNNEPPEEYLDYSDDEEEKAAKHKRHAKNRSRDLDDGDVQVIMHKKVSRISKPKDAEEIQPWVDIQKYQQSLSQQPRSNLVPSNPFRTPYSHLPSQDVAAASYAKPHLAAVMTSKYTPERNASSASQGGTDAPKRFTLQQNLVAPQQSMSPSSAPFPYRLMVQQRNPVAESSAFYPSHPQMGPHLIQSRSPIPHQVSFQTGLPVMYHQQRPLVFQAGMSPNPIFGQVPYFNQGLPSPMGVPPPVFRFGAEVGNHSPNFMNPPPNYTSQALQFQNQAPIVVNQPPNFVNQSSNLVNQNALLVQAPTGSQWQQGPPSPYGISPLSISIPSTPPPNAIHTPIPPPYNVWTNESPNFSQNRYLGNVQ